MAAGPVRAAAYDWHTTARKTLEVLAGGRRLPQPAFELNFLASVFESRYFTMSGDDFSPRQRVEVIGFGCASTVVIGGIALTCLPYSSGRIRLAFKRARFGIATDCSRLWPVCGGGCRYGPFGEQFRASFSRQLGRQSQAGICNTTALEAGEPHRRCWPGCGGQCWCWTACLMAGYGCPRRLLVAVSRGWIGGIVSVDSAHRSRFARPYGAFYYLVTLLLQLVPYSLVGGAGVNLGFAAFGDGSRTGYEGSRLPWLRIPYEAIADAGWIYLYPFRCSRLHPFLSSRCDVTNGRGELKKAAAYRSKSSS